MTLIKYIISFHAVCEPAYGAERFHADEVLQMELSLRVETIEPLLKGDPQRAYERVVGGLKEPARAARYVFEHHQGPVGKTAPSK